LAIAQALPSPLAACITRAGVSTMLKLEPKTALKFCYDDIIDAQETLRLTNRQRGEVAWKIEVSLPELYTVNPSCGMLKPQETQEVVFTYQGTKSHYTSGQHRCMILAVDQADLLSSDSCWEALPKGKPQECAVDMVLEFVHGGGFVEMASADELKRHLVTEREARRCAEALARRLDRQLACEIQARYQADALARDLESQLVEENDAKRRAQGATREMTNVLCRAENAARHLAECLKEERQTVASAEAYIRELKLHLADEEKARKRAEEASNELRLKLCAEAEARRRAEEARDGVNGRHTQAIGSLESAPRLLTSRSQDGCRSGRSSSRRHTENMTLTFKGATEDSAVKVATEVSASDVATRISS